MDRLPDEIVICDGGSSDDTLDIIEAWSARASFPVRVIVEPGANISEGRNCAIGAASFDWIAVTDAGTVIDPRWLTNLLKRADGNEVVSGFYYPSGETPFERFLATMISYRADEVDAAEFLPSSRSLLIRKSAWEAVGGYPTWLDYCEDLVFDLRMKSSGARFAFAPDAVVSWSARSDARAFAKQYYRYARGDGKAGLWPKRHAIRYGAYAGGLALLTAAITNRAPLFAVVALAGAVAYNGRYLRRVLLARETLGRSRFAWLAAVVPVGTLGDVAKMIGYPVGLAWRRRNNPPSWRETEARR
jgi:glycosyltransferase involved in cell wall biosynthesis